VARTRHPAAEHIAGEDVGDASPARERRCGTARESAPNCRGNAAIVQESGCAPDFVPVQSCGNRVAPGRSGVEKISPGPFLEVLGARHNCPPLGIMLALVRRPYTKGKANPPWGKSAVGEGFTRLGWIGQHDQGRAD